MERNLSSFIHSKKKLIVLSLYALLNIFLYWRWIAQLVNPDIQTVFEEVLLMPSQDGLVWKDTPNGIELQEIHNPYVSQLEIGDILIKIDQQPIFFAKSLKEILKTLPPGSVLMYQVKRPSAHDELIQVLVRTYPKVIFKPYTLFFQWIYQIFNIAALLFGILLILLLYPFLNKTQEANQLFYFGIFFIIFNLLYLILDFQPVIYQEKTEILFNFSGWIFSIILLFIASIAIRWKLTQFIWIDLFLDFVLLIGLIYSIFYKKMLISLQNEVQMISIALLIKSLWLNILQVKLHSKGIFFTIALLSGIFLLIYDLNVYTILLLWFYTLAFIIYWVYKYLKISKISSVAQQFVLIIMLMIVFSISYFLAGLISSTFPYDFQNIVKIIISFCVTIGVLYFVFLNKNWWKKWLFFSYENKLKKLQNFQISMTHYTHTEQLIEDFKKEIYDFLGDVKLEILLEIPKDSKWNIIIDKFTQNTFWAKANELSKLKIPLEDNLIQEWEFIFPLVFSNEKKGLVLIGKKKEGYYNLEEAEILHRTIIQLTLIINLLTLLEKEKILVQKTLEANLTALRSQINPHFLFNTLNTISSLIHDSPDLAEEAVEHLAFIFRYTLRTSNEQFATLKNEMDLIKHYLQIEKIRFGKRLTIDIQVDKECEELFIPSLVIQTLVENCIKHGVSKLTKDALIKIQFHIEGSYLVGQIFDNGPGIKPENIYKGTGLSNILTRLEQIYGSNHQIKLENTGNGTLVTLKIPIQKEL
jgi:hypothetical protein